MEPRSLLPAFPRSPFSQEEAFWKRMQIGRSLTSIATLLTLMAAAPMAAAQTGRAWVDPPAEGGAAPSQAPKPQNEPQNETPVSPPPQAAAPAPAPAPPPMQLAQPPPPVVKPETP